MSAELTVRLATHGDLAGLHALRYEVFVREQGVSPELERDAADATAVHAVAERDGQIVATGRMLVPGADAVIGRMAVARSARGQGLGAAVLRVLEAQAACRNLPAVQVHAQRHAAGFYARAGYVAEGAPFLEAGIEHVAMRKPLPVLRPAADADSAALIELIGACFADYPGCVLEVDAEEPWLREPATAYAREGGRLTVATSDGQVVACAGYRHGQVKNVYVAASARRAGLGSRLVRTVEDAARAAGANRIELWTDTRFLDAHRMYERLGYRRTGRTRELHDLSDTVEYHFEKTL